LIRGILEFGVHRREARVVKRYSANRNQPDERQRDRWSDRAVSIA
jgi:hypothetical protein